MLAREPEKDVTSADIAGTKPKAASPAKPAKPTLASITDQIKGVIENGKFIGIDGKKCEASDDMVEWLENLIK